MISKSYELYERGSSWSNQCGIKQIFSDDRKRRCCFILVITSEFQSDFILLATVVSLKIVCDYPLPNPLSQPLPSIDIRTLANLIPLRKGYYIVINHLYNICSHATSVIYMQNMQEMSETASRECPELCLLKKFSMLHTMLE